MTYRSLLGLLLASFAQWTSCSPQGAITTAGAFLASAAPDLNSQSASSGSGGDCNACYVIADVAALVWYSEVFAQTVATEMVSVGVGNGTRATSTSIVSNFAPVSINAGAGGGGAIIQTVDYSDSVILNGATLVSPTAYNVFTAYSVTSQVMSGGLCSTVSGSRVALSAAYSETLAAASGRVVLDQNGEAQFINFLGFSSCSAGGVNIVPTALAPVSQATATTTMSFSSGSPIAAMASSSASSASSTSSASSAASSASSSSSSSQAVSAAAPVIVFGNTTITPTPQPLGLQTININGSTAVIASTIATSSKTNYTGPSSAPVAFNSTASGWQPADRAFLAAWMAGVVGVGLGAYIV